MTEKEISEYITNGRGKFTVKDGELGTATVVTNKVWTDENGSERVSWSIVNHASVSGFEDYPVDSLSGFVAYLLDAAAKVHWTVGA